MMKAMFAHPALQGLGRTFLPLACFRLRFAAEEGAPGHVQRLVRTDHAVQVPHQTEIFRRDDPMLGKLRKRAADDLDSLANRAAWQR